MSADLVSLARVSPRPQARGQNRRAALLAALEAELHQHSLVDVSIGAVTRRAGLGRSAFYFYFPSKHAAVAELLAGVYDELRDLGEDFVLGRGAPRNTLAAALHHTVSIWAKHRVLFCAMLDSVAADKDVAEVWAQWIQSFEEEILRIAAEQSWDLAIPAEIGLRDAVSALLAMNTDVLEPFVRAGGGDAGARRVGELIAYIWTNSLFGSEAR